ncbi:hypothetical protein [Microbaculum marinisediminis]|uniref:hypothetical protein n=1 Tax=Microbaculum marinisediminis TaxID=2931392 RepID=UPI003CC67F56
MAIEYEAFRTNRFERAPGEVLAKDGLLDGPTNVLAGHVLNAEIGQLVVERDFLAKAFDR